MPQRRLLPVLMVLGVLVSASGARAADYRGAFNRNAVESVRQMAEAQLKAHPHDPEAQAWLERALYREGRFQAAQQAISRSSGLDAWLAQGDYDLFVGAFHAAVGAFERARALAPRNLDARLGLASAYNQVGSYDAAYDLARKTEAAARREGAVEHARDLVIQGGALGLKANRGNLFDKIRFGPRVRQVLDRAVALAPDFPEGQYALGRYYLEAPGMVGGNPQMAVKTLRRAMALDPYYFLSEAWYIRALKKTGQSGAAAAEAEKYKRKFSGMPRAMAELANS